MLLADIAVVIVLIYFSSFLCRYSPNILNEIYHLPGILVDFKFNHVRENLIKFN